LGSFYLDGDAIWCQKWATNISKSSQRDFKKYLYHFIKIFLDDFIIYSDMESHLMKLKLCFQNCKKYKIRLNLEKCVFMVFSRLILGSIVSKEGNIPDLKKVQAIVNMLVPINPQQIKGL
jgi:cleavage and polyadenylation specificity factor subunit 1